MNEVELAQRRRREFGLKFGELLGRLLSQFAPARSNVVSITATASIRSRRNSFTPPRRWQNPTTYQARPRNTMT